MTTAATTAGDERIATGVGAIGRALREAVVSMLAVLATLACAMAVDPEPGPAVLAVVLGLSLSRSHLDRDRRGRLEAAIALPLVGLVATGVGLLLLRLPWAGAIVFTAGMAVSIWLRRYGPMARRLGSLIALPFVAILTTPYLPTTRQAGPLTAALVPVLVALMALLWVTVFHALARRLHLLPPTRMPPARVQAAPRLAAAPESAMRPMASTRMAIQMAVALGASFVVGYIFFPERWAWIVLTAVIVNSGNRGRLDVVYKSVLRVLGAAFGTWVALALARHTGAHDGTTIGLILAAVFLGTWLRPLGYAWWALFVTIALALLQGFTGTSARAVLGPRLEEILVGALLGVVSAWLVYPVRSTAVLRRRLADALAALADAFDPATPAHTGDAITTAMIQLEQVAPAFRASRFATSRFRLLQPADWVDALSACHAPALVLIAQGQTPASVRRAIGAARKALREPGELLGALRNLQRSMANADAPDAAMPTVAPSARSQRPTRSVLPES